MPYWPAGEAGGRTAPALRWGNHQPREERTMVSRDDEQGKQVTRREVLGTALALGAAAVTSTAAAQQVLQNFVPPGLKPKPKGPRVFMDYDKDEIDWAYDQAPWAPNAGEVAKRNA